MTTSDTPTHYLITRNHQAIGVTAADEAAARQQAEAMGIANIVVRVDRAMTQAEWDAATAPKVIADYPAYSITESDPEKEWQDGEIFAIPRQTRSHGTLWYFYTLGSVAAYAASCNEDPETAVAKAIERGHKLYWANANAVSITAWQRAKETREGLELGRVIRFAGKRFLLANAPNGNVELVEVAE